MNSISLRVYDRVCGITYRPSVGCDIDGCLLDEDGVTVRIAILQLLTSLKDLGFDVYIWSGGGVDYAKQIIRDLHIEDLVTIIPKGSETMSIAIDDIQTTMLGTINLIVSKEDA